MNSKIIKLVLLLVLMFGVSSYNIVTADASTKVMWGKTELKLGQVGKVTVLGDTNLYHLSDNGQVLTKVRTLKKGEEFRVYSVRDLTVDNYAAYYAVGGNNYIKTNGNVKYETPSKSKLALLKGQIATSPSKASSKTPGSNVNKGVGTIKGNITWQYNKFIGTKPDVGATITLFPVNNTPVTVKQVIAVQDGKMDASSVGIYYTSVDGFGSYELTDIPAGNYFALYQSSKTFRNYLEPVESDIYEQLKKYVSDYEDGDFGIDLFNHMYFDIKLKANEQKTISKDWGYSY